MATYDLKVDEKANEKLQEGEKEHAEEHIDCLVDCAHLDDFSAAIRHRLLGIGGNVHAVGTLCKELRQENEAEERQEDGQIEDY